MEKGGRMRSIGQGSAGRGLLAIAAVGWLVAHASAGAAHAADAPEPVPCVGDADGDRVVKINELIIAVNNALGGCPEPAGALGTRTFTIAPVSLELRTALFTSALLGMNVAGPFTAGPLQLVGGTPDANGVAPLTLGADASYAVRIIDMSVVCFRLLAAGSSGSIDCDGGTPYDAQISQASGETAPDPTIETGLGTDAGAGAATLLVMQQSAQLPSGAPLDDCATATYTDPVPAVYTTARATAVKGVLTLSETGENFSCADFAMTDGVGMLVSPAVAYATRAGGDLVNVVRLADK
jgi:hypothetical protein